MTDARARLHAMFNLSETDEAELNARIDAVVAAETTTFQARVAELETFAQGCDGEGCVFPHSSWCERAKQQAEGSGGCTCPRAWPDDPHPHASYCWLVSPPRNEVDEMRKRIAELEARPSPAAVMRKLADKWAAHCPEHTKAAEVWVDCPGDWVFELRRAADDLDEGGAS